MHNPPLPPELTWIKRLEPNDRRFCELVLLERAVYAGQPAYRVGRRAQKVRAWRDVLKRLAERKLLIILRDAPSFDPLVSFLTPPSQESGTDAVSEIRARLDTQPYYSPLAKLEFALLARYVDEVRAQLRKR